MYAEISWNYYNLYINQSESPPVRRSEQNHLLEGVQEEGLPLERAR